MWPCYDYQQSIIQQPDVVQYLLVVDGMINSRLQWFAQLPTVLSYMLLTQTHKTCNVLHTSTKPHLLQSILSLPYNSALHPGLICSCLILIKAMRTYFYCWVSGTEDDGGGLQWDFISRCWIGYAKSGAVPESLSPKVYRKTLGTLKKGRQNFWSTIIIKPSGPYICSGPWIDKWPNGNLTPF